SRAGAGTRRCSRPTLQAGPARSRSGSCRGERARCRGPDPVRKRLLAGAGVVVLLLAGAAAAYYFYERHQSRDIRGSSTVEFVPTELAPKPPPPPKRGSRVPAALTRVD